MISHFNARWIGIVALCVLALTLFPVSTTFASPEPGEFTGTITSLPASGLIGDWIVGGKTVHVSNLTYIEQKYGAPAVGKIVEVKGTLQADGSINALKIEVKSSGSTGSGSQVKFYGTIVSLPAAGLIGDWVVAGQMSTTQSINVTVQVSATTKIEQTDGKAEVGAFVKVEGIKQADGSVKAHEIEVKSGKPGTGTKVELYGKIESLPAAGLIGDWKVNGQTIHVANTTKVDQKKGQAQVGAFVKVEGLAQADGSVNAHEIEVRTSTGNPPSSTKYIKFYGVIQTLPASGVIGDWTVNGLTVHVDAATKIEAKYGAPVVGGRVEVKGVLQADGSVNALKLEVKPASATSGTFGKAGAIAQTR
jgi:hypothetical protein